MRKQRKRGQRYRQAPEIVGYSALRGPLYRRTGGTARDDFVAYSALYGEIFPIAGNQEARPVQEDEDK